MSSIPRKKPFLRVFSAYATSGYAAQTESYRTSWHLPKHEHTVYENIWKYMKICWSEQAKQPSDHASTFLWTQAALHLVSELTTGTIETQTNTLVLNVFTVTNCWVPSYQTTECHKDSTLQPGQQQRLRSFPTWLFARLAPPVLLVHLLPSSLVVWTDVWQEPLYFI